jgi:hypothetical protein
MKLIHYHAYLLRLWSEEKEGAMEWSSQLDHLQSGRRLSFDTLEQLFEFLRQQTKESPAARAPPEG